MHLNVMYNESNFLPTLKPRCLFAFVLEALARAPGVYDAFLPHSVSPVSFHVLQGAHGPALPSKSMGWDGVGDDLRLLLLRVVDRRWIAWADDQLFLSFSPSVISS